MTHQRSEVCELEELLGLGVDLHRQLSGRADDESGDVPALPGTPR